MASKKKKASPRAAVSASKNPLTATIESRWRRTGETLSIERIASELGDVPRYDIVAALKELEKAGAGEFFVGHAGLKSRFEWATPSARAAARTPAKKRPRSGKDERALELPDVSEPSSAGDAASPLSTLEHRFYLRPGFVAAIELPADVTQLEVERFCQFLQAIPFGRDGRGPRGAA